LPKREQDTTNNGNIAGQSDEVHELIISPDISSVDSTSLKQRKTHYRNGITLKTALTVVGRYSEQATRPYALEGRIAEKANVRGNALNRLTSAQ
jgi:hypothetical protein